MQHGKSGCLPGNVFLIVLLAGLATNVRSQVDAGSAKSAATPDTVLAYASRLLGADLVASGAALSDQAHVEFVQVADSTTPFVAEDLNRRAVLVAKASGVPIRLDCRDCGDLPEAPFNVEIYLDSTSQKLLKVVLRSESYDPGKIKKAQSLDADRQMERTRIYRGLPDHEPLVNLLQAMAGLSRCPLLATEIIAIYTMQTNVQNRDGKPHPFWNIFLYGSEAFGFGARLDFDLPLYMRNYIMYLVDAETGKCLYGSTVPAPDHRRSSTTKRQDE